LRNKFCLSPAEEYLQSLCQFLLPAKFPWTWWISLAIALVIGVPATTLMLIGVRDAGEEALRPKRRKNNA